MSINLEKAYFKKLEEYVGKKLNIVSNENEITIIYDVETSYVLQEEKEIFYFYCIQRNERIKIAEYYSEKEMETNFAIAIKGFFSEGIDYSGLEKIEGVVKLSDVNEIMKVQRVEISYFSGNLDSFLCQIAKITILAEFWVQQTQRHKNCVFADY